MDFQSKLRGFPVHFSWATKNSTLLLLVAKYRFVVNCAYLVLHKDVAHDGEEVGGVEGQGSHHAPKLLQALPHVHSALKQRSGHLR